MIESVNVVIPEIKEYKGTTPPHLVYLINGMINNMSLGAWIILLNIMVDNTSVKGRPCDYDNVNGLTGYIE